VNKITVINRFNYNNNLCRACLAFTRLTLSCPAISCPVILSVRLFHVQHFQSSHFEVIIARIISVWFTLPNRGRPSRKMTSANFGRNKVWWLLAADILQYLKRFRTMTNAAIVH